MSDTLHTTTRRRADPVLVKMPMAARLLSVSERTLRKWVKGGLVPVVRKGGLLRFSPEAMRHWAREESRTAGAAD